MYPCGIKIIDLVLIDFSFGTGKYIFADYGSVDFYMVNNVISELTFLTLTQLFCCILFQAERV